MRTPWLKVVLWLVAAHSVGVGIGLMVHPDVLLSLLGFREVSEPFFVVQGGVFHIVMATAYVLGALEPEKRRVLVRFAVAVKVMAAVFLLTYWVVVSGPWSVAASGVVDGGMAAVIAVSQRAFERSRPRGN